uniref:Kazal-type serine protease inhibitor domain-containing protein n=1 Tax=Neospora caninum (strain Liverpool) TaxID=572307 RepID=A0A0F7UHX9_NEOCL|nr:TPA: Kazal-type serine protease inhibitor domain-containing protein [Neospora caninum Liverpool]
MNRYMSLIFVLVSVYQPLAGAEEGISTNCNGVERLPVRSQHCRQLRDGWQDILESLFERVQRRAPQASGLLHNSPCVHVPSECRCPQKAQLNCGVDNNTYYNHCMRECDGVQLNYEGPCTSKITDALTTSQNLRAASPPTTNSLAPPITKDTSVVPSPEPVGEQTNDRPHTGEKQVELNCGVNGKTYANNCLRECDNVAIQHEGPCETEATTTTTSMPPSKAESDCGCSRFYEPNCGTDKLTYANHCLRQHAGSVIVPSRWISTVGWMERPIPISAFESVRLNEPNCGADGKTYVNQCFRECHDVELKHEGRCTEEDCSCSPIFELNCGEDGKTYANHCMRECQGVSLGSLGPCPASDPRIQGCVFRLDGCRAETVPPKRHDDDNDFNDDDRGNNVDDRDDNDDNDNDEQHYLFISTDERHAKRSWCDVCPSTVFLNCGENGTTYINHCQRECQGIRLLHEGPCELQGRGRYRGFSKTQELTFPGLVGTPMRTITRLDH